MMFFASLKMMLLYFVPQWCDVCHKMWRSHASLGEAVIIGRSPASFAEGKHHSKNAPLSVDKSAFFVGGRWWIRTTEVKWQQIYSLPPLAAREISHIMSTWCGQLELVIGVEPTTCWLQISCSAIEPHQRTQFASEQHWYYTTVILICQAFFSKNQKNFYFCWNVRFITPKRKIL